MADEPARPDHFIDDQLVDRLTVDGWLVVHAADRVDLCFPTTYLTPGRPRVSLQCLTVFDVAGREPGSLELAAATRWRVESDGLPQARTFADVSTARKLFLEQADALAASWGSP